MSVQAREAIRPATNRSPNSAAALQRRCACGNLLTASGECDSCRLKRLQNQRQTTSESRKTAGTSATVPDIVRSPGQPLANDAREYMEARFGHDFSRVRVHADGQAAQVNHLLNAEAFTTSSHIVLGAGHHADLQSRGARELLAHELAHVIQQRSTAPALMRRIQGGTRHDPAEQEADRAAKLVAEGKPAGPIRLQPTSTVQRKLKAEKPGDMIPNPGGKGLAQTNAATVQSYLQTLCAGGSIAVDKTSGDVSLAAGYCPTPMPAGFMGPPAPAPAEKSSEPTGCGCICDMVASSRQWTVLIDDTDWPHTMGQRVTAPSPNSPKLWGAASVSGKAMNIDPWLVLGHELCGHAWLNQMGLPDSNVDRGEGGHQETVERENLIRKEHGLEERGRFKDPYCGESFWQEKKGPGPIQWSSHMKKCEAWRKKTYGGKYKISDKIP